MTSDTRCDGAGLLCSPSRFLRNGSGLASTVPVPVILKMRVFGSSGNTSRPWTLARTSVPVFFRISSLTSARERRSRGRAPRPRRRARRWPRLQGGPELEPNSRASSSLAKPRAFMITHSLS